LKARLNPPRPARCSWKKEQRSSITPAATARFLGERTPQPSRATLAALTTAAQQFSDGGLQELRRRCVEKREHPVVLRVIDGELERRGRAAHRCGR